MRIKLLSIFLLITIFSFLNAEEGYNWSQENFYARHAKKVAYEVRGEKTIAAIHLSDDSVWNCSVDITEEHLLANIEENFIPGAEVTILTNDNHHAYRLYVKNKSDKHVGYLVGMTKETKKIYPTIVDIEEYLISEGGWFTSAKHGSIITLSDGSVWKYPWSYPRYIGWNVGSTIIPTQLGRTFYLINIDASYNLNGRIDARLIGGSDLTLTDPPL